MPSSATPKPRLSPALVWLAAGFVLLAAALFVQFYPPLVERQAEMWLGHGPGPGLVLGSVVAAITGTFCLTMALPSRDLMGGVLCAVVIGLFLGLAPRMFNADLRVADRAAIALSRVQKAEQALGHPTPLGNRLRAAMASLDTARANDRWVRQVNGYTIDQTQVIAILSAAPVLGSDHPVIDFVAANGMVRPGDRERAYRDVARKVDSGAPLAGGPAQAHLVLLALRP